MNMNHKHVAPAALILALVSGACVSQDEYDEAVDLARHYQARLHDLEQDHLMLQMKTEDLQGELLVSAAEPIPASYTDMELELERLRAELDKMGQNPDDIAIYSFEDGSYLIRVQDQVLFGSGSAEINEDGKSKLIALCQQINASPHGRIWVRGHTDDDPVKRPATLAKYPHGNLQLSAARAVEVAMVMINAGKVGEKDVYVMGFGEHMPLKQNTSSENKHYNRRVEIYVSNAE